MDVLRRAWRAWRRFGQWMGDQIARVFLVTFYFTVALPFGLLVAWTQDPLELEPKPGAGWTARRTESESMTRAQRLY